MTEGWANISVSVVALIEILAAIILLSLGVLGKTGKQYKELYEATEKRCELLEKDLIEARSKFDSHSKEATHIETEYRILKKEIATLNSFMAKDIVKWIEELQERLRRCEQRDRGNE